MKPVWCCARMMNAFYIGQPFRIRLSIAIAKGPLLRAKITGNTNAAGSALRVWRGVDLDKRARLVLTCIQTSRELVRISRFLLALDGEIAIFVIVKYRRAALFITTELKRINAANSRGKRWFVGDCVGWRKMERMVKWRGWNGTSREPGKMGGDGEGYTCFDWRWGKIDLGLFLVSRSELVRRKSGGDVCGEVPWLWIVKWSYSFLKGFLL